MGTRNELTYTVLSSEVSYVFKFEKKMLANMAKQELCAWHKPPFKPFCGDLK